MRLFITILKIILREGENAGEDMPEEYVSSCSFEHIMVLYKCNPFFSPLFLYTPLVSFSFLHSLCTSLLSLFRYTPRYVPPLPSPLITYQLPLSLISSSIFFLYPMHACPINTSLIRLHICSISTFSPTIIYACLLPVCFWKHIH